MQNSRCVFLSDENVIAARMRSALLFNNKKNKTGGARTDMVRKAIFALIIEKDRSIEAITNIFKTNFSGTLDPNTVLGYLKDLYKSGLIQFSGNGDWNDSSSVLVCQKDDNFFRNLQVGTEKLINGIIEKAKISIQNETFPNHDVVFETVREALSVYFKVGSKNSTYYS